MLARHDTNQTVCVIAEHVSPDVPITARFVGDDPCPSTAERGGLLLHPLRLLKDSIPRFVRPLNIDSGVGMKSFSHQFREGPYILVVGQVRHAEPRVASEAIAQFDHVFSCDAVRAGLSCVLGRRALRPMRESAVVGAAPIHKAQHLEWL